MSDSILNIYCPSCAAPAHYDIYEQSYLCSYCNEKITVQEAVGQKSELLQKYRRDIALSASDYSLFVSSCSGCGASIVFEENEALANCAFCNRSLVRKKYVYKSEMPESVVPFGITYDEARKLLTDWCQKNKYRRESKQILANLSELKAFYLPYEMVIGPVSCTVGRIKDSERYDCNGYIQNEFINCSNQLDNLLLDAMEPYDLTQLKKFDFGYVAGHRVKISDIDKNEATDRLTDEIAKNYRPIMEKMWGTKAITLEAKVQNPIKIPVLLPVYYISNDNIHAAVNGQTGKVSVRAVRDSHYVALPWWLTGILTLLLACAFTFSVMFVSGADYKEALFITGVLAFFYLIIFLAMIGEPDNNPGVIGSYRKIFTSGEHTYRRERGKLVLRDDVLHRKIAEPVFKQELDGKSHNVTYIFRSTRRVILMLTSTIAAVFLPVIFALFINGFNFSQLNLGGSAAWFCLTVPLAPILLIKVLLPGLYTSPIIYIVSKDGSKKRYHKKSKSDGNKIIEVLSVILRIIFVPPLCFAVWFGLICFGVMVYLTAFGF